MNRRLRQLNGAAFWLAAVGCIALVVWLGFEPLSYVLNALTSGYFAPLAIFGEAPRFLSVILTMVLGPLAVRRAQAGRWRSGWAWMAATYGGALGLAFPLTWAVWAIEANL